MRVAIATDIHGNRHAFEAVIDAAERDGAEELWCLGDLVGYGGDPDASVELARRHCSVCLAGNHDLAVVDVLSLEEFSRGAALAATWTRDVIAPETREFLLSLKPEGSAQGVGLFHASPRDPIWEYVLSGLTAELCFDVTDFRVSLIGHSHVALSFDRQEGSPASGTTRKEGTELDIGAGQWLINPGSTGPAARRRPARRLAAARHGPLDGDLPAGGVRHRGRPGGDPRRQPARLARRAPPARAIRPVKRGWATPRPLAWDGACHAAHPSRSGCCWWPFPGRLR